MTKNFVTALRREEILRNAVTYGNVAFRPTAYLRSLFHVFDAAQAGAGAVRYLSSAEATAEDQRIGQEVILPLLNVAEEVVVFDVDPHLSVLAENSSRWCKVGRSAFSTKGPADWLWLRYRSFLDERLEVTRGPIIIKISATTLLESGIFHALYDPLVVQSLAQYVKTSIIARARASVSEKTSVCLLPARGFDGLIFLASKPMIERLADRGLLLSKLSLNLYCQNPPPAGT